MLNTEEFIAKLGITVKSSRVDKNPRILDKRALHHWRCLLRRGSLRMPVYHSRPDSREPTAAQILDSLAVDVFESHAPNEIELAADLRIPVNEAKMRIATGRKREIGLTKFLGEEGLRLLLDGTLRTP